MGSCLSWESQRKCLNKTNITQKIVWSISVRSSPSERLLKVQSRCWMESHCPEGTSMHYNTINKTQKLHRVESRRSPASEVLFEAGGHVPVQMHPPGNGAQGCIVGQVYLRDQGELPFILHVKPACTDIHCLLQVGQAYCDQGCSAR